MLTRQIRDAVDIVDLIGGYVSLKRAGASYKALCPFHQEKTPSFTVHPVRQTFKCFGCDAGGDIFTFVQLKENVDFVESRRILAERAGISLEHDRGTGRSSGPGKSDLIRANDWAQRVFRRNYEGSAGESVRAYVENRGITTEMADAFGLGLAVDSYDSLIRHADESKADLRLLAAAGLVKESQGGGHYDTFRNRLMFPIHDVNSRIIGFGGRTLGDDPAKYLNTPATAVFDKGRNLFGLDRARQAISDVGRVVVVEGYTDCMMAHQFGFAETVATLGTAMTDEHAAMLRRFTDRVILLFDSDEAGRRAANRALSVTLNVGLDVFLAYVPGGKDPCDYLLSAGETGFDAVLNQAIGALESKWRQVAGDYSASETAPGRRRAIEAFLQELAGWSGRGAIDPIAQGLLVNQLSKILSLPAEDLHGRLQQMQRRSSGSHHSPGMGRATSESGGAKNRQTAEQHAWRQMIEVLLNEPQRFAAVADRFDPEEIRDEALSAVARAFVEMIEAGGSEEFRLDELIGRFGSPEYGRLITDLQAHGEARGEFEATLVRALRCIASARQSRTTTQLAEAIRGSRRALGQDGRETVPSEEDERLKALAHSARQPHFAPTRARRRFLADDGE